MSPYFRRPIIPDLHMKHVEKVATALWHGDLVALTQQLEVACHVAGATDATLSRVLCFARCVFQCAVSANILHTHSTTSSLIPFMDASYELPDSTDWLATSLPAFESVEAALRCEVCKEFLCNPVITSCSHTFCSICIRRCIAADGKCPSCKTGCSSDKLTPNIAVREVVMRFQEARPKAIALARADKEDKAEIASGKKRKLDETDIEDEENVRHTRSRQVRGKSHRNEADDDMPVEIADSEADSDQDFVPQGMAKCPICNRSMKAELVYNHLDVCTGQDASQGRHTRSKYVPQMTSSSHGTRLTGHSLGPKLRFLRHSRDRKKKHRPRQPDCRS